MTLTSPGPTWSAGPSVNTAAQVFGGPVLAAALDDVTTLVPAFTVAAMLAESSVSHFAAQVTQAILDDFPDPIAQKKNYQALYRTANAQNTILYALSRALLAASDTIPSAANDLVSRILLEQQSAGAGGVLVDPVDDAGTVVFNLCDSDVFTQLSDMFGDQLWTSPIASLFAASSNSSVTQLQHDQVCLVAAWWVTIVLQLAAFAIPSFSIYDRRDGTAGAELAAVIFGTSIPEASVERAGASLPHGADPKPADSPRSVQACGLAEVLDSSLPAQASSFWDSFGMDWGNPDRYADLASFASVYAALMVCRQQMVNAQSLQDDASGTSWVDDVATKTHLEYPSHFPSGVSSGSLEPIIPQWAPLASSGTFSLDVPSKPDIYYADPLAQLCLLICANVYGSNAQYAYDTATASSETPALAPPHLGAASLEFRGAHSPHLSHRSGFEVDLSNSAPTAGIRKLTKGLPNAPAEAAFAQYFLISISPNASGFPGWSANLFDWYGKDSSQDTATAVAAVRLLTLCILLSGARQLLFADPWLFTYCFRQLRAGLASWRSAHGSQLGAIQDSTGLGNDPSYLAAPDSRSLDMKHWNHFHTRFVLVRTGDGTLRDDAQFVARWLPVWIGLGISQDTLNGYLDLLYTNGAGSGVRYSTEVQQRIGAVRKLIGGSVSPGVSGLMGSLLTPMFDGVCAGERVLRTSLPPAVPS